MRRNRWLAVGLVTLVALALGVAVICLPQFQKWYQPPVLVLPQDDDVAEVRASLREFKVLGDESTIPEFVVPKAEVPAAIQASRSSRSARAWAAR